MYSTNYNLNNPTSIFQLEVRHLRSIFYHPEVKSVTREHYHALKVHDNLVYVISDYPHEIYYGDALLSKGVMEMFSNKPEYYLKYNEDTHEYILAVDRPNLHYISYMNGLTEIARYKDPQVAINKLVECNRLGNQLSITKSIYESLLGYIKKDNTLIQSILSIIAIFGYKETPEYQMLIETITRNSILKLKIMIASLDSEKENNKLYGYFISIYNIFEKYKFFTDKKYDLDLNEYIILKDEINDIIKIMIK